MPEFYSQSAETHGIGLDAFTRAYIVCLYFTESGAEDEKFDSEATLSAEALAECVEVCKDFQESNAELLAQAYAIRWYDAERAGHDFWLTRNGHGSGFWDRGLDDPACVQESQYHKKSLGDALSDCARPYGEAYAYVGDDGLIYIQ